MSNENSHPFQKEDCSPVPGVSLSELRDSIEKVQTNYGIASIQSMEAAAYSFAMVVRFALGLSAEGGLICAVVREGLPGAIVLACLRHLTNAGAEGVVLVLKDSSDFNPDGAFAKSLQTIEAVGVKVEHLTSPEQIEVANGVFSNCHNILFGLASLDEEKEHPLSDKVVEALNEQSTPVHCVLKPHGIPKGELLFASSTLSKHC